MTQKSRNARGIVVTTVMVPTVTQKKGSESRNPTRKKTRIITANINTNTTKRKESHLLARSSIHTPTATVGGTTIIIIVVVVVVVVVDTALHLLLLCRLLWCQQQELERWMRRCCWLCDRRG